MRILTALAVLAVAVSTQAEDGLSAKALVMMDRVSAPTISPDGRWVAYVVRSTDLENNRGRTGIWLAATEGNSTPRQLTGASASASSPAWAPDGSALYFLSDRSESNQVWKLPLAGGEATQVTEYPVDVDTYRLAPSGDRLAFSAAVYPDCLLLRCTFERLAEKERAKSTGQVYEQLLARHWDTWTDGPINRVFTAPLTDDGAGEPVLATGDIVGNVPSRPFGGAEDYAFSSDGKSLFVAARLADRQEAWSTNFDIYRVPANGKGRARNLTQDNPAWDAQPTPSPDGRYLAYLAMERPGFEADRFQIKLMDLRSGNTRSLAPNWDRSVGSLAFAPDGESLFISGNDTGRRLLWRLDLEGDAPDPLTNKGYVGGFDVGRERVVYAWDTLARPADLFAQPLSGASGAQLTSHNRDRLARIKMGEYEQFQFQGWNDETVYGYVMKPAEYRRGRQYPVAFLIHGGPQGSFGDHFHYRWNPQVYANEGYAAVFIDFHGSTGYGQAFTDSITGDWGGKPLEDLQKGLEAALEKFSYLDGDRVCALGASYGGYMINWIAGNWPDRFKCLVNHDGVFDMRSMYYTTEELWFVEWEHGGPYFKSPQTHEKHNPALHVEKWRTPMLVIQGELDYRVPIGQALGTFTALQRRDIPSKLLYFPDENHWVLKPQNSLQWHSEVMSWLQQWLED